MELRLQYWPKRMGLRRLWACSVRYPQHVQGTYRLQTALRQGRTVSDSNSILDEVIGGWQTAATVQWQSGNPFTPEEWDYWNTYSQGGGLFANVVSGVNPYAGGRKIGPTRVGTTRMPSVTRPRNVWRCGQKQPAWSVALEHQLLAG